ncbi:hypothetical protein J6590_105970 [Homalodisca vitripennis]|nr:hypothetical protein J6590_105970 [Homalodisca vitripennis]
MASAEQQSESHSNYSRNHERVLLAVTNRMDRPARRCNNTRQLPPGTARCGYSGEQVGNVNQGHVRNKLIPQLRSLVVPIVEQPPQK